MRRWFRFSKKPPRTGQLYAMDATASFYEKGTPDPLEEIVHFKSKLKDFGLELDQIVTNTPKNAELKKNAIEVAEEIANDAEMANYFITKKRLPLFHEHRTQQQKQAMKKQRVYITAVTLIMIEKYQILMQYVPVTGGKHS